MFLDEASQDDMTIWSVSDFSQHIQKNLQQHVSLAWIMGEISGLYKAQSGHIYATIKDTQAQMKIVIYASVAQKILFRLEEGLKVRLLAQATIYKPKGELQLVIKSLEPDGIGALKLAFDQLKKKLADEGLFDSTRKKPLPRYPRSVALITSADGAVYHDMMRVLMRRYPIVKVTLYSCSVQGGKAIPEILSALQQCAHDNNHDVAIIARGGGSLEDLWAFNSEEVVRAVAAFPLPLISAIGHETDLTLCDFAADVRAATPSVAAELAVPVLADIKKALQVFESRWWQQLKKALTDYQQRLDYQERFLQQTSVIFQRLDQQLMQKKQRLDISMRYRLQQEQVRLQHYARFLKALPGQFHQKVIGYWKTLKKDFESLHARISFLCRQKEHQIEQLNFKLTQANPIHPEQLTLFDIQTHTRLKSSAGITPGSQAKLQFFDGSWIIEFIDKIEEKTDMIP